MLSLTLAEVYLLTVVVEWGVRLREYAEGLPDKLDEARQQDPQLDAALAFYPEVCALVGGLLLGVLCIPLALAWPWVRGREALVWAWRWYTEWRLRRQVLRKVEEVNALLGYDRYRVTGMGVEIVRAPEDGQGPRVVVAEYGESGSQSDDT